MAKITLENINKVYVSKENQVVALKDINVSVENGEILGIVGFSGAGKSTLVRMINLLERPTSGKVFLEETELTALPQKELRKERRRIGMIFQQFQLFASRTVFQNVAFPLKYTGLSKEEIAEKVRSLLRLVDLGEKEGAYPSELSGGQKQRVAIARALATDPEVLLSDVATSALDPQATKSILELLKKLNRELGITIVMITHEMDVVKDICQRVIVMEHGQIVEEGGAYEIFSAPKKQITKDFVNTTMNMTKIGEMIDRNDPLVEIEDSECVVRFTYPKNSGDEPLVSKVSREFGVDINIFFGNIDYISGRPIGGLVSVIHGDPEKVKEAIRYFREQGVKVEVLKSGRLFN
ncbi:MAG: ATP-binding cassette domain-containing protein [Eubacteriales bacterium]|nr:ATP-binding cassette domain-containing protein [Eubacteriales bacterium]